MKVDKSKLRIHKSERQFSQFNSGVFGRSMRSTLKGHFDIFFPDICCLVAAVQKCAGFGSEMLDARANSFVIVFRSFAFSVYSNRHVHAIYSALIQEETCNQGRRPDYTHQENSYQSKRGSS